MKTVNRDYKICTLDKHLDCAACEIASMVDCSRHRPQQMTRYYKVLAVYAIPGLAIMTFSSFLLEIWWLVPGYLLYWLFYQIVGELGLRCRHCPFWDEASATLNCRINCGVPKLHWLIPPSLRKYDPSPLKIWQKIVIQSLSILTILIPLVAGVTALAVLSQEGSLHTLSFAVMFALIMAQIASGIYFILYLTRKLCATCVHFSCPNNRQPRDVIEKYLEKNEIMDQSEFLGRS